MIIGYVQKTALISIAALFLTTETTHAQTMLGQDVEEYGEDRGTRMFECGDVLVDHRHVSDVEIYTIEISAWHKQRVGTAKVRFQS
jgi:hypothetical protein